MEAPVVEKTIWGTRPDEESFEIKLAIGRPERLADMPDVWECPVELSPLYRRLRGGVSDCSLQSLCLTLSLVFSLLDDFREKGGRLGYGPGEDGFSLEHYAFGSARKKGRESPNASEPG